MFMSKRIELAREFSPFPFGRYPKHGPFNGERFRTEMLLPPLMAGEDVTVVLDGARGLGPSFLEEAFGGLVRAGISADRVFSLLSVVSDRDPSRKVEVERYIREQGARSAAA